MFTPPRGPLQPTRGRPLPPARARSTIASKSEEERWKKTAQMRVAPTILKSHLTQIKQSSVYFDWVWCMVLKTINFPLQRMTVIYHIDINEYAEDMVVNDSSDTIHVVLTKMFSFNSLAKTVFFYLNTRYICFDDCWEVLKTGNKLYENQNGVYVCICCNLWKWRG